MKQKNYKYIILFITLTVIATIGLQLYWNLKNYKENERRLINEVQAAFDNSIEHYYVEDVKNDFVAFINKDKSIKTTDFIKSVKIDTLFKDRLKIKKDSPASNKKKDTLFTTKIEYKINSNDQTASNFKLDSIRALINPAGRTNIVINSKSTESAPKISLKNIEPSAIKSVSIFRGKKSVDSIAAIKDLTNRIVISMIRDSIDFKKLSKNLKKELERKKIAIAFAISHFKTDTLFEKFQPYKNTQLPLETISKSTYLPQNQTLKLSFSNPVLLVLKKSVTEIILSFLLSLSIIGCMLYLLWTINKQKKVDEIKNDLISNITHEFKTPITTISSAIEGIKIFNTENDPEKTKRYLSISENQLEKLSLMVEKLLETASLETDSLALKKENINIFALLESLVERYSLISPKSIRLHSDSEHILMDIDAFHFENAISNLIDNAIKYGGDIIDVILKSNSGIITITVKDNGSGIDKKQKDKIFEKFYRIPKGNIHDVKGFGIGLYYAKKIIEKHSGSLKLLSNTKNTVFQITIPDGN